MAVRAYIGIGSNLGEPRTHCLDAAERLERLPDTRLTGLSPWYMSRPVGVDAQGWFINGVARLETRMSAVRLLGELLQIEVEMGRIRNGRPEPRVIDLDLLLYGTDRLVREDLTVPHPRLHLRRFVMVPLMDLDPELMHPSLGLPIGELLNGLDAEGQELIPLKGGRA